MVQLLNEALQRKGDVNIDVCAILNDTTGEKTGFFFVPLQNSTVEPA